MTKMEKAKTVTMLVALAELHQRELSQEGIDLFVRAIDDLPFSAVEKAFRDEAREGHILPTPAIIRERIEGCASDRAERAYRVLLEAMDHAGYYRTVVFEDWALGQTVESLGGWMAVYDHPTGNPEKDQWWHREFVKVYQSYARQQPGEPVKCLGFLERGNRHLDGPVHPPYLVGRSGQIALQAHETPALEEHHE